MGRRRGRMREVSGRGQGSLRMRTESGTSALTLSSRCQGSLSVSFLCYTDGLSFFFLFNSVILFVQTSAVLAKGGGRRGPHGLPLKGHGPGKAR